jgi:hypothetical protein
MSSREPPALAAWLLGRFVAGDRSEALLGDLFEEYQTGRTNGWYWRETLVALLISMRRTVCRLVPTPRTSFILALIAQSLLAIWIGALSQRYPQQCPALPTPLNGLIAPLLSVAPVQIAIALLAWLRLLGRDIRVTPNSGLVRWWLAALVAVGLGGGALTWAATAACTVSPPVCSSSPAEPCILPGNSN